MTRNFWGEILISRARITSRGADYTAQVFFLLDVLLLAIRHAKPPPPSGRKGVAISVFFHHLVRHGGEGDPSNGRRRLNEGVPNESQATELVRPPAPPRKKRDGWMFWEGRWLRGAPGQ